MPEHVKSVTDSPVYWFAVLEKAVDSGNLEAAGQAVSQLRRLGVEVIYRSPAALRREVAHVG